MRNNTLSWIAAALLILGATMIVIWAVDLYTTLHSLWTQKQVIQVVLADDPTRLDPAVVGRTLYTVRRDVVALRRQVGWLAPVGRAFRRLPKVGGLAADAPALLELADALTEAGVLLWDDVAPAVSIWQAGTAPTTEVLTRALAAVAADAPQAQVAVRRAREACAALNPDAYPDQLRAPLAKLMRALPLLDDALTLAPVAPKLLGVEAPRTYLVLALNEDELRPGGGFITGVGELHIRAGEIVSMTFADSYTADDFSRPYPWAPEPMQRFMGIQPWVFRDSNWSPDFPTAARQAIALYRPGHPVTVDGVIALNQYAVRRLVDAVGPLALPGSDAPITGDTLLDYIYRAWEPEDGNFGREWWRQHKSFMKPLAEAVLAKVQAGEVDVLHLVETCLALLEERHLMVYIDEPTTAAWLAAKGWDGGLRSPDGDYLMAVEANVGYNKASAKLHRALTYEVDLSSPETPRATVTLAYTHTSQAEIVCKLQSRYDPIYVQMMDRCYWGYVRLYVPEGATLLFASRHRIPAELMADHRPWDGQAITSQASEGPYTVFAQAFLLPPRGRTQLTFAYALPPGVVRREGEGWQYHLTLQKQPSLRDLPVRLLLHLPQDAVLWSAQPPPLRQRGRLLSYVTRLDTDLDIELYYGPPSPAQP